MNDLPRFKTSWPDVLFAILGLGLMLAPVLSLVAWLAGCPWWAPVEDSYEGFWKTMALVILHAGLVGAGASLVERSAS